MCTEAQGNALIGIIAFGAQVEPLKFHIAQEIGLGEWRALVGGRSFLANQGDLSIKAFVSQLGDKRRSCLTCSYNDDMRH